MGLDIYVGVMVGIDFRDYLKSTQRDQAITMYDQYTGAPKEVTRKVKMFILKKEFPLLGSVGDVITHDKIVGVFDNILDKEKTFVVAGDNYYDYPTFIGFEIPPHLGGRPHREVLSIEGIDPSDARNKWRHYFPWITSSLLIYMDYSD